MERQPGGGLKATRKLILVVVLPLCGGPKEATAAAEFNSLLSATGCLKWEYICNLLRSLIPGDENSEDRRRIVGLLSRSQH